MDRGPVKGGTRPPGGGPEGRPRRGLPPADAPRRSQATPVAPPPGTAEPPSPPPEDARRGRPVAAAQQPRHPRAARPVPVAEEIRRADAEDQTPPRPRRLRTGRPVAPDAPREPDTAAAAPPAARTPPAQSVDAAPAHRDAPPAPRRRGALPPPRENVAPLESGALPRRVEVGEMPPAERSDPGPTPAQKRLQRRLVDAPDSDAVVENGPIVAPATVAGRSLTVIIAIMTFLCALLMGGAIVIDRAASSWSATVLDDISVAVLPLDGDPVGRRLQQAAEILRATPGLDEVAIVPAAESEALLQPWLGSGTDLSLLPVPRLLTARRTGPFDARALSAELSAIPGASLDDHTAWSERLERMAGGATLAALLALVLILGATAIAIVFATRAAIAGNAATVEVLSVLGAEDSFVVRAFRSRFLRIGLRGALIGLAAAVVLFGVLEAWSYLSAGAASRQAEALLGAPHIGAFGFGAIVVLALAIAGLVTLTTGLAVRHHLKTLHR